MATNLPRAVVAFLAVILVALGATACVRPGELPPREEGLDRCLSDERRPLDPAPILAAWHRLARGEPVEPLHVRAYSAGLCTRSWWTPVLPIGCGEREPHQRMFALGKAAGMIVYDLREKPPRPSVYDGDIWVVDDHFVQRTPSAVTIPTARGPVRVAAVPELILDDRLAIVAAGQGLDLLDLASGRRVLAIRPRAHQAGTHAISGPRIVRDPAAPNGLAAISATDYIDGVEVESFAIDGRGKLLASARGPAKTIAPPVVTGPRIVLVAQRADALEVQEVDGGAVRARRVPLLLGPPDDRTGPSADASGDTILVQRGARVTVLRGSGAPFPIDAPGNDVWSSARLLTGGIIAVLTTQPHGVTVVLDTRTNTELLRTQVEPRFAPGLDDVLMIDDHATDERQRGVVIGASGDVRRGPLGTTTIGRFSVPTFAGVADPELACDARALSQLPPLLRYDDLYLPAALVVD